MTLTVIRIIAGLGAAAALWFAYDQLTIFRRTMFWEYRYIIFAAGAFVGLTLLEKLVAWLATKIEPDTDGQ